MPWSVLAVSVPKPRNDRYAGADGTAIERANEDRWIIRQGENAVAAAVADGAGASGLCCGAWAECLVRALPDRPVVTLESLDQWLAALSAPFQQMQQGRFPPQSPQRTKFVREGSYATLAAIWLNRDGPQIRLDWLAYGDSVMLVFDRSDGGWRLLAVSPAEPRQWCRAPLLLNWKDVPVAAGLAVGDMDVPGQALVVLASDAVGQMMLQRYLASHQGQADSLAGQLAQQAVALDDKWQALQQAQGAAGCLDWGLDWQDMAAAMADSNDFARWVADHYAAGRLVNDDCTVIAIIIDVKPPVAVDEDAEDQDHGVPQSDGI